MADWKICCVFVAVSLCYHCSIAALTGKKINERCSTNADCGVTNGECSNKVCGCKNNYYYYSKTECREKFKLNENCNRTVHCGVLYSECISNTCQCSSNHYPNGTKCEPRKFVGSDCEQDYECINVNICGENKTCICGNGYYQSGPKACRILKKLGDKCSNTAECGDQVHCDNNTNTCSCPKGFFNDMGKCEKDPISMKAGDDSITFSCTTNTPNQPGKISVMLNMKAKAVAIYARNKMSTCGLHASNNSQNSVVLPDTMDASAPFKYLFEIDTANQNHSSACGVQTRSLGNDSVSTVFFTIKTSINRNIIKRGDGQYMVRCNWNQDLLSANLQTASKVTGKIDNFMANKGVLDAVLEIYSDNQGSGEQEKKSTVTLSDTCSIRITLQNINTNLVKRAKINDVMANHINDFGTNPLTLFGKDGCGNANSGVVNAGDTFLPATTFNNKNPTKFQYKSADFGCFKFINGDNIYYRSIVVGCMTDNDTLCQAPTCPSRSKRSIDPDLANRTDELIAFVRVASELTKGFENKQDSDSASDASKRGVDCLTETIYPAIIGVLVVLLLVSVAITLCFCSKLLRSSNKSKMEVDQNPVF